MTTSVSVVIPTRKRTALLRRLLDCINNQSVLANEIHVIVDGADDDVLSLKAQYKSLTPIKWHNFEHPIGVSRARNVGVLNSGSDVVAFLDDDTRVNKEWLFHHIKHHDEKNNSSERIVVLGACYINEYTQASTSFVEGQMRILMETSTQSTARSLKDGAAQCFGAHVWIGLNTSMRRAEFIQSGGYDPALDVQEDLELGMRLSSSGFKFIYEPSALVFHTNTRMLADDHKNNQFRLGVSDVYRASVKRQRNLQNRRLIRLFDTKGYSKLKERFTFKYPSAAERLLRAAERMANSHKSKTLFSLSHSLANSTYYWKGVHSTGIKTQTLKALVGEPRPILMFHSVASEVAKWESAYNISTERFWRAIRVLLGAGFKSVINLTDPAVTKREMILTFDDGYEDVYCEVFPKFSQLGIKALVYVVVDRLGKVSDWHPGEPKQLLSKAQILEMHRHGVQFGSHTSSHANLISIDPYSVRREVSDSKKRLEDMLGTKVDKFAYPWGLLNEAVRAAVADAGYSTAVTIVSRLSKWDDPLRIPRIGLSERDTLLSVCSKILTGRDIRNSNLSPKRVLRWYLRGMDTFSGQ